MTGYTKAKTIVRDQRYPQYTDAALLPFFDYIAQGYCYKQASDKCRYNHKWMLNTLHSDDEVSDHMMALSLRAGGLIRSGQQAPPTDRYDGLWDKYLAD